MLERTLAVTLARGLEPLAEQILDGIIAVVGAERGFVGLVEGEGWRFLAARRLSQADIDDPASQVSTHIIREALACGEPLVTHDATQDFAGQRFFHPALDAQQAFAALGIGGLHGDEQVDNCGGVIVGVGGGEGF